MSSDVEVPIQAAAAPGDEFLSALCSLLLVPLLDEVCVTMLASSLCLSRPFGISWPVIGSIIIVALVSDWILLLVLICSLVIGYNYSL